MDVQTVFIHNSCIPIFRSRLAVKYGAIHDVLQILKAELFVNCAFQKFLKHAK